MAASDSSRTGDLNPLWFILFPGCSNPTSLQPKDGDAGSSSLENMGGSLPWGCDQQETGSQDQL